MFSINGIGKSGCHGQRPRNREGGCFKENAGISVTCYRKSYHSKANDHNMWPQTGQLQWCRKHVEMT